MPRHNRHVLLLRERWKPLGQPIRPEKLYQLLQVIGWDVDLALTALTMLPRPEWVSNIVGPLGHRH